MKYAFAAVSLIAASFALSLPAMAAPPQAQGPNIVSTQPWFVVVKGDAAELIAKSLRSAFQVSANFGGAIEASDLECLGFSGVPNYCVAAKAGEPMQQVDGSLISTVALNNLLKECNSAAVQSVTPALQPGDLTQMKHLVCSGLGAQSQCTVEYTPAGGVASL